ncbi:hypothetical protein [Sphingomonas sp. IC4-52]|uniref:hypothetical protein n=1 Tax=Sphingomonas sp. IC4-52 TaxID=2887202 RepID=UPI001D0FC237|nr:hypothetical protein [Sphingomonas sp. IC4-52]MCC2980942.1 hypothetical protein [Sphingomonas sp. IC4-52]
MLKTMLIDKVALIPVRAEVPHLFSDRYSAALVWAEEVTNISAIHASDQACAAAAAAFTSKELVDLTLTTLPFIIRTSNRPRHTRMKVIAQRQALARNPPCRMGNR